MCACPSKHICTSVSLNPDRTHFLGKPGLGGKHRLFCMKWTVIDFSSATHRGHFQGLCLGKGGSPSFSPGAVGVRWAWPGIHVSLKSTKMLLYVCSANKPALVIPETGAGGPTCIFCSWPAAAIESPEGINFKMRFLSPTPVIIFSRFGAGGLI